MDSNEIVRAATKLAHDAESLSQKANEMLAQAAQFQALTDQGIGFMPLFTVFVLACFVGYYVVWRVTPALHSPLMAVTNAVSSVIIVGALVATSTDTPASRLLGFLAVILASVNIFGGFLVTQRMLGMFKKKQK